MVSLVGIIVVTFVLLGVSIWRGYSPLLGLDLQGGVEVVLRPTEGQNFEAGDIDTSVEIIRRRVDALGVAEPDITRQSNNVVVQLPGVDDQQRAIELIGQTAELTFRPVLYTIPIQFLGNTSFYETEPFLQSAAVACGNLPATELPEQPEPPATSEDTSEEQGDQGEFQGPTSPNTDLPDTQTPDDVTSDELTPDDQPADELTPDDQTPDEQSADDQTPDTETPEGQPAEELTADEQTQDELTPDEQTSEDQPAEELSADDQAQDELTPDELTPDTQTPDDQTPDDQTLTPNQQAIEGLIPGVPEAGVAMCRLLNGETDDPQTTDSDEFAVFGDANGQFVFLLSPAGLTGSAVQSASPQLLGVATWIVALNMRAGAEGIDLFNQTAASCFNRAAICPTQQLAIVLDGVVESAPNVEVPRFERDQIQISGGFSEREARDLGLVLRYGALPVEFEDPAESGLVRTVSATLGRDSLRAGVIAGVVGMVLVAAYILIYYRLLGALALLSLMLSGTMLWVVVSFLSETRGLALTLAGITGLIVSLGVSLDSNVVYFEHLKEGVANGSTVVSSVNQAFPVAFKTIFWANLATLIGAGILWWLTVGSVRGFAAMLAIASILDLIATYFFLRPAVRMLAGTPRVKRNAGLLGMPTDIVLDAHTPLPALAAQAPAAAAAPLAIEAPPAAKTPVASKSK